MELQRYIGIELSGLKRAQDRVLEGLTQAELAWRPASGCNPIGLILFHMARTEDALMQRMLQQKALIWHSEKWYEKLGLAEDEEGSHYTADQVNAFPMPALADILSYADAVRAKTKEKLRSMPVEAFNEKVTFPNFGEMPVGALFSFMIAHAAEHIGEISYLRGMQRGMDK
ncbi:DinB family protein [Desulfatitalea alkaliphila]|uniref:DinB family protein n=1 Tax=Desulfatitalea alkaliphila TaxID=2929485 RepID=A0AA41UHN1_9BACT|nr:DinB family protein [Desulfatitalea alkaliphila]MCJ8499199.1 DinB family protein [Desulfatitalea alkaliphila]